MEWKVSYVDLLLLLLLAYNLPALIRQGCWSQTVLYVLAYSFSRQWGKDRNIHGMFIAAGCLQMALMALQGAGLLESGNGLFRLTGSFGNPGILGGCLALGTTAVICSFRNMKRGVFLSLLLGFGVALIATDSRAAWVAVAVVSLRKWMEARAVKPVRRVCVYVAVCIAVGVMSLTLYKPDSAKGRLLIWTVSMDMIKDRPLTGQGFGGFQREYMNYQSQYFLRHPQNDGIGLAGNNRFAFNEFIRIGCEQGLIAAGLVVAVIAVLSIRCIQRKDRLFPCLLAFLFFACFSYPCSVFLLNVMLAVLFGALSRRVVTCRISISSLRYVGVVCAVAMCLYTGHAWVKAGRVENGLRDFLFEDDYQALAALRRSFEETGHSPKTWFRYARALYLKGEYGSAVPAIRQAISFYPTTDKYCDLGNACRALGRTLSAEEAYRRAADLLPCRVYPRYCLFLLYRENGEREKALAEARRLMAMRPKIINRQYREIKNQAEKYVKEAERHRKDLR